MQKFVLSKLTDYSDESVLDEVRRVARELGSERITRERFNQVARVSSTTLTRKFGSWFQAMDRAGVSQSQAPRPVVVDRQTVVSAIRQYVENNPGSPPTRDAIEGMLGLHRGAINHHLGHWKDCLSEAGVEQSPLGRRYTDAECFENIVALWTHYGRQPNFAELKRPPSAVGPKAYIGRWGGWRAALTAFIDYVENQGTVTPEFSQPVADLQFATPVPQPATVSRSISLSTRYQVLVRDRFTCQICGRSPAAQPGVVLHLDHIHPWSKGGDNSSGNLRVLCFDCNLGKGDKLEV
ncbi:MAG: HNH endonuclease [Brevundimonas sp.]|nr:HNH endonuclease [Brevundimonas sp.]